jgi:hypothetical protein
MATGRSRRRRGALATLPELSRQPTEGVAAMRTSGHSSIPGGGDFAQANYELTVVGSLAIHSPGGVRPARVPSSRHYFEIQLDRGRGVCDPNGLTPGAHQQGHCFCRKPQTKSNKSSTTASLLSRIGPCPEGPPAPKSRDDGPNLCDSTRDSTFHHCCTLRFLLVLPLKFGPAAHRPNPPTHTAQNLSRFGSLGVPR